MAKIKKHHNHADVDDLIFDDEDDFMVEQSQKDKEIARRNHRRERQKSRFMHSDIDFDLD